MGCLYSKETEDCNERYRDERVVAREWTTRTTTVTNTTYNINTNSIAETETGVQPCYGEYRCECGRYWKSLLSWRSNKTQICKACRRHVYPRLQRELRPSDISHDTERKEHPREYCQMCRDLGYYCGRLRKYKKSTPNLKVVANRNSRKPTRNNYNRRRSRTH